MEKYLKIPKAVWSEKRFRDLWERKWSEKSRVPSSYPWPFSPMPEKEMLCLQRRNRFRKIRKKILPCLLKKFKNKCAVCGEKTNLVPDHVIPICFGGTNEVYNFQILCSSCNSLKSHNLPKPSKKQRGEL